MKAVFYMKKVFVLLLMSFFISGCSLFHIYKMDIEQGNIITPKEINQLQIGMDEYAVKDILGTPVLVNIFTKNQVYYTYLLNKADGSKIEKHLVLYFQNGKLNNIRKN
jgi:outer membrane protein assembly factor BamE